MASSPLSIASFPSFQVPGQEAKWITSEHWEAAHFAYSWNVERQISAQILRPPKAYSNKREQAPFIAAKMILASKKTESEEKFLAWSEIQVYPGRFTTAFLFCHLEETDGLLAEQAEDVIGCLISMSFFTLGCDQIRLILPTTSSIASHWAKQPGISISKLISLPAFPTLRLSSKLDFHWTEFKCLNISRGEWDEMHQSKNYYAKLKYIKKRRERLERISENKKKKVRRRSLIARIFRPKIDDSLF